MKCRKGKIYIVNNIFSDVLVRGFQVLFFSIMIRFEKIMKCLSLLSENYFLGRNLTFRSLKGIYVNLVLGIKLWDSHYAFNFPEINNHFPQRSGVASMKIRGNFNPFTLIKQL